MDIDPGRITDASGWPGRWETISRDDYWQTIAEAGGLEALSAFAGCTHPHGRNFVSTTWGVPDQGYPLVLSESSGCDPDIPAREWARCPGRHTFQRFTYDASMEDEQ